MKFGDNVDFSSYAPQFAYQASIVNDTAHSLVMEGKETHRLLLSWEIYYTISWNFTQTNVPNKKRDVIPIFV